MLSFMIRIYMNLHIYTYRMLLSIVSVLFCTTMVQAQDIKSIRLGEVVPDINLQHVLNYKDSVIRLSEFKNKGIILDFFSTYCGSCIEYLPHLDSLQSLLGESLQILVVCFEPKEKIRQFLSKRKSSIYQHLPFITEDSLLEKLFPHVLIPHEVWIDRFRKVFNTTEASAVSITNLHQWLATGYVDMNTKVDRIDFDRKKSLLALGDLPLLSQRIFTRNISGLPSTSGIMKDPVLHTKRFYHYNLLLSNLIQRALSFPFSNRIVWKSKSIISDNENSGKQFLMQSYCSDITLSDTAKNALFQQYLLEDIRHVLNIKAYIDTQDITCYKLVSLRGSDVNSDKSFHNYIEDANEGTYVVYHNWEIQKLISYFDYYSDTPVIDGSPKGCRINLKLHTDNLHNYSLLRKELQSQGLDLIAATARLPVIVVENSQ